MAIRTIVVGLGRAGALAPAALARHGAPIVRNHVEALLRLPGFELVGVVDNDSGSYRKATRRHPTLRKVPFRTSLGEIPRGAADVVVIATPTSQREAVFRSALALKPRMILVEKPLAADARAGRRLLRAARKAGVDVRVHFNRRFDGAIQWFLRPMPKPPTLVVGRYSKGLFNYASHLVDLLMAWYGPPREVRALEGRPAGSDPTLSFACVFAGGLQAYVLGVRGVKFDQFEVELDFANRRLAMTNNGVEKRSYVGRRNLYYPGYTHLVEEQGRGDATPTGGYLEFYEALGKAWGRGRVLPGCTGDEGQLNLRVLDAVLRSARKGGRAIAMRGSAV
ncbi:MAG: Gfo/Idh/MocA family oxidoreductase [Alphaproteobacteria bacterium]|nr:Gfo/Idh/MocA family oxidoreductase [Alphaproteobacteria bacterium]